MKTKVVIEITISILLILLVFMSTSCYSKHIESDEGIVEFITQDKTVLKLNVKYEREYKVPDEFHLDSSTKYFKATQSEKIESVNVNCIEVGQAVKVKYELDTAKVIEVIIY